MMLAKAGVLCMSTSVFFILAVVVITFVVIIVSRGSAGGGGGGVSQIARACPQCGEANPGQAAFCRKCGRALR